jgi:hypothetical protein
MNASRSKELPMLIGMALLVLATFAVASPVHQVLDHSYESICNLVYSCDYRFLYEHRIGDHFI